MVFYMSNNVLPSGVILAFSSDNIPEGWLKCDGSIVSRTVYAALYAAIGDSCGNGDGSTTFHLPDYRGRFLRGTDDGSGRDPNAGSRTAMNSGGDTGDSVSSIQADATAKNGLSGSTNTTGNHNHQLKGLDGNVMTSIGSSPEKALRSTGSYSTHGNYVATTGNHSHTVTLSAGDSETRPLNA